MCDKSTLDLVLSEAVDGLKDIYGDKLKKVVLFGSYARGDYDDESDIDIAVLLDMGNMEAKRYKFDEIIDLLSELNLKHDVLISTSMLSLSVYEEWKGTLPLYRNIEAEGVVLSA